jgi:hypothetical protein
VSATADLVEAPTVARKLITWLETGSAPDGLFADDVFLDATLPHWRVQADNRTDALAVRSTRHPFPGTVRVERLEPTSRGFALEVEERWRHEGQDWYCREAFRADVVDGRIQELKAYCTGDWDEEAVRAHAAEVTLIRP